MQAREKRKYFLESMRRVLLPREFFIKNECLCSSKTYAQSGTRENVQSDIRERILIYQAELATLYQHQEMLEKKQYQPLMDIAAQRKEQSEQCLQTFFKRCK